MPNYARRQQHRRLVHAGVATLGSVIAALLGLATLSTGAAALAGSLFVATVGLGLYARHWFSLAGRSRVGACSEDEVRRALAPLEAEGWLLLPAESGRLRLLRDPVEVLCSFQEFGRLPLSASARLIGH